jgi:hypothetical protein
VIGPAPDRQQLGPHRGHVHYDEGREVILRGGLAAMQDKTTLYRPWGTPVHPPWVRTGTWVHRPATRRRAGGAGARAAAAAEAGRTSPGRRSAVPHGRSVSNAVPTPGDTAAGWLTPCRCGADNPCLSQLRPRCSACPPPSPSRSQSRRARRASQGEQRAATSPRRCPAG